MVAIGRCWLCLSPYALPRVYYGPYWQAVYDDDRTAGVGSWRGSGVHKQATPSSSHLDDIIVRMFCSLVPIPAYRCTPPQRDAADAVVIT